MTGSPSSTRRFIRHYVEMLLAMVAGMVVLGLPAERPGPRRRRRLRVADMIRQPDSD